MRRFLGMLVLMLVMAAGCSQECPAHSSPVWLTDGGGDACMADWCYQPAGDWASDGFVLDPSDPDCAPDGGAEGLGELQPHS